MREWTRALLPSKKMAAELRKWRALYGKCEENLKTDVPEKAEDRDQHFITTTYNETTDWLKTRVNYIFKSAEAPLSMNEQATLETGVAKWVTDGWTGVTATTGSTKKGLKPANLEVSSWSQYIMPSAIKKNGTPKDKLALIALGESHRNKKRRLTAQAAPANQVARVAEDGGAAAAAPMEVVVAGGLDEGALGVLLAGIGVAN